MNSRVELHQLFHYQLCNQTIFTRKHSESPEKGFVCRMINIHDHDNHQWNMQRYLNHEEKSKEKYLTSRDIDKSRPCLLQVHLGMYFSKDMLLLRLF